MSDYKTNDNSFASDCGKTEAFRGQTFTTREERQVYVEAYWKLVASTLGEKRASMLRRLDALGNAMIQVGKGGK